MILLSSVSFILAISQAKKDQLTGLKAFMAITLILGLLFVYFQFQGFNQLKEKGIYGTSTVMVSEGKYGAPFEVQINGDFVYVEDNTYKLNDKPLSGKNFDLFNSYLGQFIPSKKTRLVKRLQRIFQMLNCFMRVKSLW